MYEKKRQNQGYIRGVDKKQQILFDDANQFLIQISDVYEFLKEVKRWKPGV